MKKNCKIFLQTHQQKSFLMMMMSRMMKLFLFGFFLLLLVPRLSFMVVVTFIPLTSLPWRSSSDDDETLSPDVLVYTYVLELVLNRLVLTQVKHCLLISEEETSLCFFLGEGKKTKVGKAQLRAYTFSFLFYCAMTIWQIRICSQECFLYGTVMISFLHVFRNIIPFWTQRIVSDFLNKFPSTEKSK